MNRLRRRHRHPAPRQKDKKGNGGGWLVPGMSARKRVREPGG